MSQILINISLFFLLWQFVKGGFELLNLSKSLKWLYVKNMKAKEINGLESELPFFYILLPVLREQKLLTKTVNYLLNLNYPKKFFKIVIITTEKENYEKEVGRNRVSHLAKDLANKINQNLCIEKYLGVFDEIRLSRLYNENFGKDFSLIENKLLDEYDDYPTTMDIAKEISNRENAKYQEERVTVIHYPHRHGVMAHQINYAVKSLQNKENRPTFISVYNADSSPNIKTLEEAAKIIIASPKNLILQQSAIFSKNFETFKSNWKSSILKSGGLLQTHWTLCHEIPRIRTQSKLAQIDSNSNLELLMNSRLAHCVGHGMFIELNLFKQFGSFSTETMNEDLPFGFKVCAKRMPILPIPVLESADTPETIKHLINQKRIWFWSYLDYLKCRRTLLKDNFANPLIINSLTIQGLLFGISWLFNSALFLFPLIIGLVYYQKDILLFDFLALLLFYFLPIFIIENNLSKLHSCAGNQLVKLKYLDYIFIPIMGLLVLFTDSLGPFITICDKFKSFFTGGMPYKQKTER